jgi:hypothetical protein
MLNLMAVVSVFGLKVTALKDRWLQPLFIWFPLLLVSWLRPALNRFRLQTLLGMSGIMAMLVALAAPGRLLFTEWRGRKDVLNAPLRKVAADVAEPVRSSDCVVAGGYWLAGNLILWFPEKHVYSVDIAPPPPLNVTSCLLIWDATRRPEPPAGLVQFGVAFIGKSPLEPPQYFEEKWKYHKTKTMRIGVLRLNRT